MVSDIIFDWGGVLGPANNIIAAKELSLEYDINERVLFKELSDNESKYSATSNNDQYYQDISKKFHIPVETLKSFLNNVPAGSVYLLAKRLSKNGYRTYILSNQMKPRTDAIKENIDLSFFTNTFFSNEIGIKKPNPLIFKHVLNIINKKPEKCVFIDDYSHNTKAAEKLGFNTILFKNVNQLSTDLARHGISVRKAE